MRRKKLNWLKIGLIWLVSAAAFLAVSNFVPSLSNASLNTLFRLRGELPAPDDIVIVAIDDASLQKIGKYPWARGVIADGLDKISAGEPRAVGIDVIYAEESEPEEDARLAEAIKKNGRVILPTQLFEADSPTENGQTEVVWLRPLPEIEAAAASEGHAHAAPDVDGTLRSIQLSKADDKGARFWAFGLEILRVAEAIAPTDFEEKPDSLRFGSHDIRLLQNETEIPNIPGVKISRSDEMLINYAGATKSYRYYSFADVVGGEVSPEIFKNKIVLVGATSPTLGDVQVTPFMHFAGGGGEREGGQAMPGVEVHANVINTIKGQLSLKFLPDFWGYLIAFLIILSATLAVKWLEGWRQVSILAVILAAIVAGSLIAFNHYFLILPMPEMLTAFLASAPLLLLDRSLAASRDLDLKLDTLSAAQKGFLLDENQKNNGQNRIVPRNLEWKLRAVDDITTRLLARMSFINCVLTGMTEGVLVADLNNRIVFVNQRLPQIFEIAAEGLLNQNLKEFFVERKIFVLNELNETIKKIAAGETVQKDFEETAAQVRHFLLQLSPVTAGDDAVFGDFSLPENTNSPVIGILILFFDVTKQRELDRLKAETLQLVSHELRSPLTSIQGLSDVLRKFPVSADESGEMLDTIHSEAVRLNEIINRFLDIKKLEAGKQDLQISAVDLKKLLADCVSAAVPLAAEKKIKIQNNTSDSLPVLQADAPLLAQAVGNLLSNAVKYSPPETIIKIEVVETSSELQIIIGDKGYGIPENALNHIFDKFYRLERDAASRTVGTGLGLSFVKEVAEKHGGRVSVESEENIGSTFILHLPYQTKLSHSD